MGRKKKTASPQPSLPSNSHRLSITPNLLLDFFVKQKENDSFQCVPLELAKPLNDIPNEKPTYLIEVKPGWLFGLRILSTQIIQPKSGIAVYVNIDNVPCRSSGDPEFLLPKNQIVEVTKFRGPNKAYPFQFQKSHVVFDPSELKDSTRKDISVVGKIEITLKRATYSHNGPAKQADDPTPLDIIKIKEARSKEKGICVASTKEIKVKQYTTQHFYDIEQNPIASIIIQYHDAIGLITEKRKRGMLAEPEILHTGKTVEVPEEIDEPPLKKSRRSTVIDLERVKVIDVEAPKLIDLDSDEEILPSASKLKDEPISEKRLQVMSWSVQDVQQWLISLEPTNRNITTDACRIFEEQEISGKVLLTLTMNDLIEIQIPTLGARKIIFAAIEDLRNG